MGNVELHKDLCKSGRGRSRVGMLTLVREQEREEAEPVLGGGYWDTDHENKVLYLWGSSVDFGFAKPEDIAERLKTAWISSGLNGYTVMHSGVCAPVLPPVDTFSVLTILEL